MSAARTLFTVNEMEAQLLRPRDRIGHAGAEWAIERVEITIEDPVVVTARRLVSGRPFGNPEVINLARQELVRIRT